MSNESTPAKSRTKAGQFSKGTSGNPKGKPPGTKTGKTLQWEALGACITATHAARFNDLLNDLWSSKDMSDRVKAADLFLKTMDYFKPRLQRVEAAVKEERPFPAPIIVLRGSTKDETPVPKKPGMVI